MIGIDLFSGAGGMSLGARRAGVDVQYVIDNDEHAAATYCLNHQPKLGFINDDIRNVTPVKIHENSPLVLFGGPPCQGFSTSNQRTRNSKNEGNWLFHEFINFVRFYSPRWVVFENVKGIVETERGYFLKSVVQQLSDLGYACEVAVLNAKDYGVPQSRDRLFIVANNVNLKYKFPQNPTQKYVTVGQALSDLPLLKNGEKSEFLPYRTQATSDYAKLMRKGTTEGCTGHLVTRNSTRILERYSHIPQGGNWENIPDHLMNNYTDRTRCHTGIYRRLDMDKPSVVIGNYRKNMLVHPLENRGLSVREAARLQSFPDHYEFSGSIGFQQQQVGNAVPPLLAQAIFESIVSYNLGTQ